MPGKPLPVSSAHPDPVEPSPMAAGIPMIDASILIRMLGEMMLPTDALADKREKLLESLCEWIGGHGWLRLEQMDRRPRTLSCSNGWERLAKALPEPPEEIAAPDRIVDLSDHLLTCTCPGDQDGTVTVAIARRPTAPPFSPREQRLARILFEEVAWLYHDQPPEVAPPPPSVRLSKQQKAIIRLIRLGTDRKSIATTLGITANTLAGHLKEIYRRLDVHSQSALLKRLKNDPDLG